MAEKDKLSVFADIVSEGKINKDESTSCSETTKVSKDSVKSKTKCNSTTRSASTNSGKSNTPPGASLDSVMVNLANTMTQGFAMMQDSLQQLNNRMEHQDKNFCNFFNEMNEPRDHDASDRDSDCEFENYAADNIFAEISECNEDGDDVGAEINIDLAKLFDKMVVEKMNDATTKAKEATYLHPKNLKYSKPPKTNKAVWEVMGGSSKIIDSKLQEIQRDLLRSALPVVKVMEELFTLQDKPEDIDATKLIRTLSDSFKFLGSANINVIKQRKEFIKNELPKNMQGLCRDADEFSPSLLFGDNLNAKIKEVSELNKIRHTVKPLTRPARNIRGNPSGFSRGSGFRTARSGFRGRRRFTPYYRAASSQSKNWKKSIATNKA